MELDTFPFTQAADDLAEGQLVPFLGAAASRVGVAGELDIPDGRQLAAELIARMGDAYRRTGADDLAKAAQYFESTVYDRGSLYNFVRTRLVQEQQQAGASRVAHMLATMPDRGKPLFIVTTNYDTVVEKAFAEVDRPLCVLTQNVRNPELGVHQIRFSYEGETEVSDARDFDWYDNEQFKPNAAFLFKMHGSAHRRNIKDGDDDLIITEDDYVDFLVNLSPYYPPPSLTAAYKKRRFLFLGYSLVDWNFRVFLRLLVMRNAVSNRSGKRHYAIQRDAEELDMRLWDRRNVNVYRADLATFCDKLQAEWSHP